MTDGKLTARGEPDFQAGDKSTLFEAINEVSVHSDPDEEIKSIDADEKPKGAGSLLENEMLQESPNVMGSYEAINGMNKLIAEEESSEDNDKQTLDSLMKTHSKTGEGLSMTKSATEFMS